MCKKKRIPLYIVINIVLTVLNFLFLIKRNWTKHNFGKNRFLRVSINKIKYNIILKVDGTGDLKT